jgi:hypothetical protein
LLLALGSATAHAGLSLQVADARDQQLFGAGRWDSLAGFAPPEGLTLATFGASGRTPPIIAGEFGAAGGVRVQSREVETARFRGRMGLAWREGARHPLSLEGSAIVYPLSGRGDGGDGGDRGDEGDGGTRGGGGDGADAGAGSEFYASVQRRHWGPGWAGSLILDGAAPAVPAVGWRRAAVQASTHPWLAWIGPWGADFFFGRLQGHDQPARPYLIGMRVEWSPVDRLALGASRTMQWGGRGRDESFRSLANSLLGNDNVGFGGVTAQNEPGNQLAGFDLRWMVDRLSSSSIYAQIVGEDEAGHLPSRNMFLLGLDARVPAGPGSLRLFVEAADLLAGRVSGDPRPFAAYRHSVYLQGYTQEGEVLGHPAGGDARLGTVGGLYRHGTITAMVTASIGRAEPSAQSFPAGRVQGVNTALSWQADARLRLGVAVASWQDAAGRRSRLQAQLNIREP